MFNNAHVTDDSPAFLREANPKAREAMCARFDEAMRRDLWRPKRNSVAAVLARSGS